MLINENLYGEITITNSYRCTIYDGETEMPIDV